MAGQERDGSDTAGSDTGGALVMALKGMAAAGHRRRVGPGRGDGAPSLAAAGAKVAVLDVRAASARRRWRRRSTAWRRACDVTSGESASAAVAAAEARHGIARILVNCAGVPTPGRAVGRNGPLPLEQFAQVVSIQSGRHVQSGAAVRPSPAAAAGAGDGQRGVIINTASVAAFDVRSARRRMPPRRAAVAAMTLPLAREFAAHGIRVVTIAPGLFQQRR